MVYRKAKLVAAVSETCWGSKARIVEARLDKLSETASGHRVDEKAVLLDSGSAPSRSSNLGSPAATTSEAEPVKSCAQRDIRQIVETGNIAARSQGGKRFDAAKRQTTSSQPRTSLLTRTTRRNASSRRSGRKRSSSSSAIGSYAVHSEWALNVTFGQQIFL